MNEVKCIKTGLDILTPYFGMRADLYITVNGDYIAKGYKDYTVISEDHDQYFVQVNVGEIIDDTNEKTIIQFSYDNSEFSEELIKFLKHYS